MSEALILALAIRLEFHDPWLSRVLLRMVDVPSLIAKHLKPAPKAIRKCIDCQSPAAGNWRLCTDCRRKKRSP